MSEPWLRRGAAWVATLALLTIAVWALAGRWEAVGEAGGLPGAAPAALAVALYVAGNALLAANWAAIVAVSGSRLRWREAAWVWATSQLSRYMVTGAQVGGRAVAGRAYGVPALAGALSTVVELAWMLSVTSAIVLATAPWWLPGAGDLRWLALLGIAPVVAIAAALAHPSGVLAAAAALARLRWVDRLTRGRLALLEGRVALTRDVVARITLRYGLNTVLRHAAFLTLFAAVGGDLRRSALVAIGAYAIGNLAGAVAVFAPGGLGVREGVSALVLAPVLGGGPALLLVAVVRLLEVAAELAFLALARAVRPARPEVTR
jgi:hypothetical protein